MNLLSIRAEALRANLNRIKDLLPKFPDRWTDWAKLQTDLKDVRVVLDDVRKAVGNAKVDTETIAPPVSTALEETAIKMNKMVNDLRAVDQFITSMRLKCFQFQQLDAWKDIVKHLDKRIGPRIQAVVQIETALQKAGADLGEKWRNYEESANTINQEVFAEYIEFLGGLALRDTGFDTGISKLAEELILTYVPSRGSDQALAIPTRRQTVALTLPRVIRVTFPDWTIWALPSTAHEFWHVVIKNDLDDQLRSDLQNITDNDADIVDPRFNDCLADAFATYTMGPAYAFFAIFLRLDPSSPYTRKAGRIADETRAHSIFKMLEKMDSKESELAPPYKQVREEIQKAWNEAIAQTGIQPKVNGQQQIDEAKEVAAEKDRATVLIEALWTTLNNSASPPFTVEVWNEIDKWVEPLLEGKVNENQMDLPAGAELRHVLNAAWLARVSPQRKPNVDLTDSASKLADRVIMPRSKK